MADTIVDMFYSQGGYQKTYDDTNDYVSIGRATGTFIAWGIEYANALLANEKTLSVEYTGSTPSSSGDIYDDRIIAEMACYYADTEFDNLHMDADTGETENRHYRIAEELILNKYGRKDSDGNLVAPAHADDVAAYGSMSIADMTY